MKLLTALMQRVSLEDVADGKVFHEKEIELYVYIPDVEAALKGAKSMDRQEQWTVKIDKSPDNAGKGNIRVRKIIPGDSNQIQYVLTAKVDRGNGDRLEVPEPSTEGMFEIFRAIATNGMIKHRYHFPIEGTSMVWEVDMFYDKDGKYYNWAKIDLEGCSGELPPLPFVVDKRIDGRTKDPEERAMITKLYDDYFITKSSSLKHDLKASA